MTALDHHPIAIDAGTRAMGAAARVASGSELTTSASAASTRALWPKRACLVSHPC